MESHVNSVREQKQKKGKQKVSATSKDNIDDCEKQFTAAQSHIAKANREIFADTAVMALVCCHDQPILLANMTSAGERQHYALALLREVFRHLPSEWKLGLLYDIACQLERSMQKVRLNLTCSKHF